MKRLFLLLFIYFSAQGFSEPIIFNTLPKSGSVYICHTLLQGLKQGRFIRISNDTFPWDTISLNHLKKLVATDGLTQEHFDASDENLNSLQRLCSKLIIHVRDPRQALISWAHHLNKIQHSEETLDKFLLDLPQGYFQWNFSDQLDWQIENYLPASIEWIQSWVKASERNGIEILFTTYEEFITNRERFFERILDFYSLKPLKPALADLPKSEGLHFRKEKVDEWREVLSPEQKELVAQIMPQELLNRFHWES